MSRKITVEIDPLVLVTVQHLAGLVWATLLLAFTSSAWRAAVFDGVSSLDIFCAAMTGILYCGVAYRLYLITVARVSAALAGASFNLIPVVAIAVSYAFLGERLSASQLAGVALILVSGFMLVWLTSRPIKHHDY